MRSFLRYFKKLHIWLLVNAALLALFFALRGQKSVMTAAAERFSDDEEDSAKYPGTYSDEQAVKSAFQSVRAVFGL